MRYNKYLKKYIILDDGQSYCNKCNGSGIVSTKRLDHNTTKLICYKCHGTGVLDWVEKVTGKSDGITQN